ncbi:TadE/TadG family type IV pilus assembly protein [Bordetella petrii]|uniref:TadE/TadG family type IV pilus assembly protein n=1 Tax=Bordetella petrii TaxID=94624 RepID=UPI00048AF1D7|nr:TadE/TadG family type IV pilus assembly protein [Bordetella petrii]
MRRPRLALFHPSRATVRAAPARNRGAALLEFALAAPPLLLLGLLAVEATHWHLARQIAYVALLDAARAGATSHGAPDAMARAFKRALRPRYASPDGDADAAQQRAFQRLRSQAGMAPWRIEVLQPSAAAFQAHARRGLAVPAAPGRRAISNDYQAEQHAARGGEPTIFEANTLHARLTFLHEPLSPLVRALLRRAGQAGDGCTARAWSRGVLPLRLELRIEMQSHPVDWHAWPAARRGPVVYGSLACAWEDG